jgi:diguanylate cyclase (GGDEF)-like protein
MIKDNFTPTMPPNKKFRPTLTELLSSEEWAGYFCNVSKTLNLDLNVYDEDGTQLFSTSENPFCRVIKSILSETIKCPESCNKLMFDALKLNEPVTFKCQIGIINFSLPVEQFDEKAFIVGRGGFSSYEDFLGFLKIAKDYKLPEIPITMPLNFVREDYVKAISQYVFETISYLLDSFRERLKLQEKIIRLTTLLDTHTFETLAKNRDLMYRYILDAIEFLLGHTSTAMMVLDYKSSIYRTAYSTGKHKDALMGFQLHAEDAVVREMLNNRISVFSTEPGKVITTGPLKDIKFLYFFPIFIADTIEGMVGIFDRELSQEDIKIINAFRDYIQVTLENQTLRTTINKKADEILATLLDLSKSIASVLDTENLFQTILEKSLSLLQAEQGSLMLLDHETSELLVEAKKSVDNIVRKDLRLRKGEGIAGRVLESGMPLLVKDVEKDPRIQQKNRPRYKTKSFVSVPIKIKDEMAGVLNISDKTNGEAFNEEDLRLIQSFTTNAAIAIERSLLYKQTEELKKLSITDPLTGIYNRRYLNTRLTEEITRYKRYKNPFSFLMLDIDGFKEYNDAFGHIAGDKILRSLSQTLSSSLRATDIAARFGGDEFVVIFPQTPKVDAIQITNRLKESLEKILSPEQMERPFKGLTISMGLTTYPDDASSLRELFEKTDQALYLAKKGGGNRIVHL